MVADGGEDDFVPLGIALAERRLSPPVRTKAEAAEDDFRFSRSMDLQDKWAMRVMQKRAIRLIDAVADRLREARERAVQRQLVLKELGADDDAAIEGEVIALFDDEIRNHENVSAEIADEV